MPMEWQVVSLKFTLTSVASVMFVTTTLYAMVLYYVWGFMFVLSITFLLFFGVLDGAFWAGIA